MLEREAYYSAVFVRHIEHEPAMARNLSRPTNSIQYRPSEHEVVKECGVTHDVRGSA